MTQRSAHAAIDLSKPHFECQTRSCLLTYDGNYHRPLTASYVAFEMEDLLPGAEHELSTCDGHGQRWPLECGLQVGVAVSVVPRLFVAIIPAWRNQLVKNCRQVGLQAGLKFDCAD